MAISQLAFIRRAGQWKRGSLYLLQIQNHLYINEVFHTDVCFLSPVLYSSALLCLCCILCALQQAIFSSSTKQGSSRKEGCQRDMGLEER